MASRHSAASRCAPLFIDPPVAGYVLEKARLTHATGATGAVTLIQRFGSALNADIHFHMLFLDGAYLSGRKPPVFRRIGAPSAKELWFSLICSDTTNRKLSGHNDRMRRRRAI